MKYVTTSWSPSGGWSYAVCACQVIDGELRDHCVIEQADGFATQQDAKCAGDQVLSEAQAVQAIE